MQGPNGTLERQFHPLVQVTDENNVLTFARLADSKEASAVHGMSRCAPTTSSLPSRKTVQHSDLTAQQLACQLEGDLPGRPPLSCHAAVSQVAILLHVSCGVSGATCTTTSRQRPRPADSDGMIVHAPLQAPTHSAPTHSKRCTHSSGRQSAVHVRTRARLRCSPRSPTRAWVWPVSTMPRAVTQDRRLRGIVRRTPACL